MKLIYQEAVLREQEAGTAKEASQSTILSPCILSLQLLSIPKS